MSDDTSDYVTGTPHGNSRRTARYETRPPSYDAVDATFADTDATYCLECAKANADGRRIEV